MCRLTPAEIFSKNISLREVFHTKDIDKSLFLFNEINIKKGFSLITSFTKTIRDDFKVFLKVLSAYVRSLIYTGWFINHRTVFNYE